MISQLLSRLRGTRGAHVAANDPDLQLGLPFGPLPLPPQRAARVTGTPSFRDAPGPGRATTKPTPMPMPGAGLGLPSRPMRRTEPLAPAPAIGRLQGQGPVSLRAASAAVRPAHPILKIDPCDARRTVLIGRLGAVCDELDRLVADEEAQTLRSGSLPS